ncbi:MAG TPA: hypothetical protein VGD63_06430 [Steroidobacteraceae bacterium]
MRLARPVYASLPIIYMLIGGFAIFLSYLDPSGLGGKAAFLIGLLAETAALTVFLRRKDERELSRKYSGVTIERPPELNITRTGFQQDS